MMGRKILERLIGGGRLSEEESYLVMQGIMEGSFTPLQIGAILSLLRTRREEGEELAGFVRAIRERAVPFVIPEAEAVADNCGTGGDGAGTFNISTASALLAVSLGVKIVKHGNRSVTSHSGSADFIERLGIKIEVSPSAMQTLFDQTGFAFLYAPLYHPAMRAVQEVRRELKIRTVFNLLGPLVNPCAIHYKLVGVYDPGLLEPVGKVLLHLGVKRGLVVWGEPGMDEVSLVGESKMALVEGGSLHFFSFHPQEVGLEVCKLSDLGGGNPQENVEVFWKILRNEYGGPLRDALLINAAFLVWLSEQAASVSDALKALDEALKSGRVLQVVEDIISCAKGVGVA
ncbi:MAG: anthranilate phosphoribosyltransferase [Candidatus Caldatribacteriaceae bacterium]